MIKILFSCHVEPNKEGDISYLRNFLAELKEIDQPVVLLLMFGGVASDKILKFFYSEKDLIPRKCVIGLHVHGGQTKKAIQKFKTIFKTPPKFISFGHWQYKNSDLAIASSSGVFFDLSFAAYRHGLKYFIKDRFKEDGLTEVPVCCNPKHPLDPFYTRYNFFIFFLLVAVNIFRSNLLHFAFHSYDWDKGKAKLIFNLPAEYVSL